MNTLEISHYGGVVELPADGAAAVVGGGWLQAIAAPFTLGFQIGQWVYCSLRSIFGGG